MPRNPREIVSRLVETNPEADREELFKLFRAQIDGEDELQRAVDWYFFVNIWSYLCTDRNSRRGRKGSAGERASTDRGKIEAVKRQIIKAVLLDMVLPTNGKTLRDATFADCAKAGGWYAKVAKMGRPNQIVGKVLTEEKLRAVRSR